MIDRSKWGSGPWDPEPDRVEFEAFGFPCILKRSSLGAWCGYVGVPPGHPAHGKRYGAVEVEVHGGLTYSDECQGEICHEAKPGEPADVWWLGFDCANAFDLVPGMNEFRKDVRRPDLGAWKDTYRDVFYARSETQDLAHQLREMAK
jgi:hypothetical protein